MIIKRLDTYLPETADRVRELLIQLSRSGKDKGEIPREWFEDIINSPWHDLLIAEEDGKIIGFACLSVTMGPGIRKNAYLEDFVVDSTIRGKGIGSALWQEMMALTAPVFEISPFRTRSYGSSNPNSSKRSSLKYTTQVASNGKKVMSFW